MQGSYNIEMVALSVILAIFASYTALELVGRVSHHRGNSWGWLAGGALALGAGIWAMHFVGMLAFHLPIEIAYDIQPTAASLGLGVLASGMALFVVSRARVTLPRLAAGAVVIGLGISAMHYTGMEAMRMSPSIQYDPVLFGASIGIATLSAFAALVMAFHLREQDFGVALMAKLGSATVMGLAIVGMHYIGMAAAEFAPDSYCLVIGSGLTTRTLATVVGVVAFAILAGTLVVSAVDARRAEWLHDKNRKLRALAHFDTLTGLPNRVMLEDRLNRAVARGGRGREPFGLMYLDLDRFKPVNDALGHGVGDALLRAVATRLGASVRAADTVARVGGDEFVILLDELAQPGDAAAVASKVLEALARPFQVDGHELSISGSVGIAMFPRDARDATLLKERADQAMYVAKRAGRNRCHFFSSPPVGLPKAA